MAAPRTIAGRIGTRRVVATSSVIASLAALLLATEVPSSLLTTGGGSAALAELLARSPGARVGGVALKAKERRVALAPVAATEGGPASGGAPAAPVASVLGAEGVPEGAVPNSGPLGGFPADFTAPAIPGALAGAPAESIGAAAPGVGGAPISGGGIPIFAPGGGGGGGSLPGGGGVIIAPPPSGTTPGPTDTTPIAPPSGPVPGVVPGIPEPSTWALLIAGFGVTGAAMRRRRRAAIA